MTNVKLTCSWKNENGNDVVGCGDISVPITDITLLLHEGKKDIPGQYRVRCPKCKKILLKDAPINIINLLYSSGVPTEVLETSIELLERPREEDAPPITLDDVLDLGLAMQDEEEMWRLLGEE